MHAGHDFVEVGRVVAGDVVVAVTEAGQASQGAGAVGADQGAGRHGGAGEVEQLRAARALSNAEAGASQPAGVEAFDRDHDGHLVGAAALLTGAAPADERLVQFNDPGEQVALGADHGPAQLVQPRPRRLIRPEPERLLQAQRGDPVLLRGHEPHRGKPRRDRGVRAVKDRARRHRGLAPTLHAHPQRPRRAPRSITTADRAHEPLRPPQPSQVLQARHVAGEPVPKLLIGTRIVHPTPRPTRRRSHPPRLLHSSRYARHTCDSTRKTEKCASRDSSINTGGKSAAVLVCVSGRERSQPYPTDQPRQATTPRCCAFQKPSERGASQESETDQQRRARTVNSTARSTTQRTARPLEGRAARTCEGQKAPVPFGVPSPVGPSQPTPAWHHTAVGQLPFEPDVTSNRLEVLAQVNDAG